MNGFPTLDSLPNEASGKETPISDIATRSDDIPVIDPSQPVQPTLANDTPSSSSVGGSTTGSADAPGADSIALAVAPSIASCVAAAAW